MKKQFFTFFILVTSVFSCNDTEQKANVDNKNTFVMKLSDSITENNKVSIITDSIIRGEGVVYLLEGFKEIEILNTDKTLFGKICSYEEVNRFDNQKYTTYKLQFPTDIIVREIIPDVEIQVFSFDAQNPKTNKDYLLIYVNGEQKLISKQVEYSFVTWEEYIKSAFIRLKEQDEFYYNVLEIKNDSMLIKSVNVDCGQGDDENFKEITKWVKWKENNRKLVNFSFCY